MLELLFSVIILLFIILISTAYLVYVERKIIGFMQLRKGPSVAGYFGLLQPFADAIKLVNKEFIMPNSANKLFFIFAPIITFVLAFMGWCVMPWGIKIFVDSNGISSFVPSVLANINVGVLYLLCTSSLGVYGIIIAGWASNSKYAFFGAVRSAAQMISYELSIGFCVLTVLLCVNSLNLSEIVVNYYNSPLYIKILLLPSAVVFFIAILAETNRHPFDLPEAESELVAGYHVEYSSMPFALFFLAEYSSMILMSAFMTTLFLGGWYSPFSWEYFNLIPGVVWFAAKIFILLFCFIWIRASFPRYRYDQLMSFGWKFLMPFSFFWFVFLAVLLKYLDYFVA